MGNLGFFYGSFEGVLRRHMVPNATYGEIANALLLSPLVRAGMDRVARQGIYDEYHIEETTIAKIRKGSRKITKELLRDYLEPGALENVERHFSTEIVPYIPLGKRADLTADILASIGQDGDISPQEKTYYRAAAEKKGLAAFLAEAYIFAVTGISALTRDIPNPQATNLPAPNSSFCGRDAQLMAIEKGFQNGAHIQGIYGMGGVGKTQIALQYAHSHKKRYKTVWWIDAENELSIQNSVSGLLTLQGHLLDEQDAERVRDMFLMYLYAHDGWLLIYDNAEYGTPEEYDTLSRYLPEDVSDGDILLTTRCRVPFGDAAHMEISVWEEREAVLFLEKRCGIKDDMNAARLAEQMGWLPLALEYAAAYIRETPGVDYIAYSQKLERHGVKVLDRKVGPQAYKRTVREAFHITLDRLLEDPYTDPFSRSVGQFLNICAFLAPDGIIIHDIAHYGGGLPEPIRTVLRDELDRDALERLLTRYSLVRIEHGSMSMHRLLQEILRDELLPADKILCINYAYGVFYNAFYSMREMPLQKLRPLLAASVPHVQALLLRYVQCREDNGKSLHDGVMAAKEYFSWTSLLLTDVKRSDPTERLEAYERNLPILQTAIGFYETLPGDKTIYLPYTLMLLAQANAKMGNGQAALEQYARALRITEETIRGLPIDIAPDHDAVQELYRSEAFLLASDICAAVASSETIYENADLLWQAFYALVYITLKQFACYPHREQALTYKQTLLDLWIFSQQIAGHTGRAFILRLEAPREWLDERGCAFLDGFYGFFLPTEGVARAAANVTDGFDLLYGRDGSISPMPTGGWRTLAFDEGIKTLDDMLDALMDMETTIWETPFRRSLHSAAYTLAKELGQKNICAFYEDELKTMSPQLI